MKLSRNEDDNSTVLDEIDLVSDAGWQNVTCQYFEILNILTSYICDGIRNVHDLEVTHESRGKD